MSNNMFYDQLSLEEERLQQRIYKIRELKKLYQNISLSNPPNNNKVFSNVNLRGNKKKKQGGTIPEKIKAALEQITEGKVNDVAKALIEKIDTSFTFDKAKKNAAYHLSKLYRNGDISATGDRRKGYVYSIKKAGQ